MRRIRLAATKVPYEHGRQPSTAFRAAIAPGNSTTRSLRGARPTKQLVRPKTAPTITGAAAPRNAIIQTRRDGKRRCGGLRDARRSPRRSPPRAPDRCRDRGVERDEAKRLLKE